jgi:hypothetical protein
MLLGVGIPVFRHLITIATGIPETIIRDTGRSEFNMCMLLFGLIWAAWLDSSS